MQARSCCRCVQKWHQARPGFIAAGENSIIIVGGANMSGWEITDDAKEVSHCHHPEPAVITMKDRLHHLAGQKPGLVVKICTCSAFRPYHCSGMSLHDDHRADVHWTVSPFSNFAGFIALPVAFRGMEVEQRLVHSMSSAKLPHGPDRPAP